MGPTWSVRGWNPSFLSFLLVVLVFALANSLATMMAAVCEATNRVDFVDRPGAVPDTAAVARADRWRRAIPYLLLNATLAGGVLLALAARRLEERRRRRLGLPPDLDETRLRAPSQAPRHPVAGRRTRCYSWLDRGRRFDIS